MLKGIRALILRDLVTLQDQFSSKNPLLKGYSTNQLIFIKKSAFCQPKEKISITKDEQMAVASYLALNYIRLFNSLSYL